MPDYKKLAQELGELVHQRALSYGNSAKRSGEILGILFPGGVGPAQYDRLLLIARVVDKLSRLSMGETEDSWRDIAGYGLVGMANEAVADGPAHPPPRICLRCAQAEVWG